MKLKLNDKVLVVTGKDKGKVGRVTRVLVKYNQIVVENVNFRTKFIKKTAQRAGEKIRFEAPLNASNVMILDPVQNKPTRVGYKVLANGKKERIAKLSGSSLDNVKDTAEKKAPKEEKAKKEATATKDKKPKKQTIKV